MVRLGRDAGVTFERRRLRRCPHPPRRQALLAGAATLETLRPTRGCSQVPPLRLRITSMLRHAPRPQARQPRPRRGRQPQTPRLRPRRLSEHRRRAGRRQRRRQVRRRRAQRRRRRQRAKEEEALIERTARGGLRHGVRHDLGDRNTAVHGTGSRPRRPLRPPRRRLLFRRRGLGNAGRLQTLHRLRPPRHGVARLGPAPPRQRPQAMAPQPPLVI
mmetsp:Transcript_8613/g.26432  ORF Transcript_8613/g.26432 Transcript_8613/m.26432 type:complete len:216 (-) Transcript_8613:1923-2570(-)